MIPRMENTSVYPSAKMAYPLPMDSPFRRGWRKDVKLIAHDQQNVKELESEILHGSCAFYVLRLPIVCLLEEGELTACAVRVHLDLRHVELRLVDFARRSE